MNSIREIYRIGKGPSSSHTMGPKRAAENFLTMISNPASFKVVLYGSLAATGKGHMTDVAILDVLSPVAPVEIIWEPKIFLPFHPNGMKFIAYDEAGNQLKEYLVFSIGGWALAVEGEEVSADQNVYPHSTLHDSQEWCDKNGCSY